MVWKTIAKKYITSDILKKLADKGSTEVLSGFISKKGKFFEAKLVLNGREVTLEFPETQNSNKISEGNVVNIRLESGNSGHVTITLSGAVQRRCDISYGLVPSRMAECLGALTSARIIKQQTNSPKINLNLFVNNLEFIRYLLRERIPRDKEIRSAVEYLWKVLKKFNSWEASYQKKKWSKLKGSPQASIFPKNIFPRLNAKLTVTSEHLIVTLPDAPDVKAQFKAAVKEAKLEEVGDFLVPRTTEQKVKNWLATVTGK